MRKPFSIAVPCWGRCTLGASEDSWPTALDKGLASVRSGITRWRHRGTPLKEEEPAEASVNVSAEAQAVATANLAPEPRPAAPEAPASSVPTPDARDRASARASARAGRDGLATLLHLRVRGARGSPPAGRSDSLSDGQAARAQLAEAADALRVLYLQSHGMLPKAKAQRHQFVWPQVADGGLDQGQGAAEAALLGYVGRVLADKGRLLVLTPVVPGEAVTAQLSALERQLPQARLCRGLCLSSRRIPPRSAGALDSAAEPTVTPALRPMALADLPAVLAVERAAYFSPWAESHFRDSLRQDHECWIPSRGRGVRRPRHS